MRSRLLPWRQPEFHCQMVKMQAASLHSRIYIATRCFVCGRYDKNLKRRVCFTQQPGSAPYAIAILRYERPTTHASLPCCGRWRFSCRNLMFSSMHSRAPDSGTSFGEATNHKRKFGIVLKCWSLTMLKGSAHFAPIDPKPGALKHCGFSCRPSPQWVSNTDDWSSGK